MAQIGLQRLSSLIGEIYAAPLTPEYGRGLLDKVADAFASESFLFQVRDVDGGDGIDIFDASPNFTSIMPAYVAHYYKSDEWALRVVNFLDQPVLGTDLICEEQLMKFEFYNEMARPSEVHHLVGGMFSAGQSATGIVSIHRAVAAKEFTAEDRDIMGLLLPHFGQVFRLMRHYDRIERESRMGMQALGALSVGSVVVEANGRVVDFNAAAERLFQSGVIKMVHGRLTTADSRANAQFAAAMRLAAMASAGKTASAGVTLTIEHAENERLPVIVSPMPAGAAGRNSFEPLAVVFIGEIDASGNPLPSLLHAVFGLTPAEASLAIALINGRQLSEYADEAGLSLHTVRSQLKSVFERSGAHRQSDLVRKLMGNPVLRLASVGS